MNRNKYLKILALVTIACIIGGSIWHGAVWQHRKAQRSNAGTFEAARQQNNDAEEARYEAAMEAADEAHEAAIEAADAEREAAEEAAEAAREKAEEDAENAREAAENAAEKEREDAQKAIAKEREAAQKTADREKYPEQTLEGTVRDGKGIPFSALVMDLKVADVTVCQGTDYGVTWYADDVEYAPVAEIRDGVLRISQKKDGIDWKSLRWLFHTNGLYITMTVTVPEGTELDDINAMLNVGDFETEGLTCGSLYVDTGVGDVDLTGVTADTIGADLGIGDLGIASGSFRSLTADTGTGDVDVAAVRDLKDYTMDLSCGVGEIYVGGKEQGRNYAQSGRENLEMRIDTGVGDIGVKAE